MPVSVQGEFLVFGLLKGGQNIYLQPLLGLIQLPGKTMHQAVKSIAKLDIESTVLRYSKLVNQHSTIKCVHLEISCASI